MHSSQNQSNTIPFTQVWWLTAAEEKNIQTKEKKVNGGPSWKTKHSFLGEVLTIKTNCMGPLMSSFLFE